MFQYTGCLWCFKFEMEWVILGASLDVVVWDYFNGLDDNE